MSYDTNRRDELLAEARRKRMTWVEEARGIMPGEAGSSNSKGREDGGDSALEQVFPAAVQLVGYLNRAAGDADLVAGGDLASILRPFRMADVDLSDNQPIPAYRHGAETGDDIIGSGQSVYAYQVFLDKLKHPLAADVVKTMQQFTQSFKSKAGEGHFASGAAMGGMLHAFLRRVEGQMKASPLWAQETERQWSETIESLERFVVHKIYDKAFALCEDAKRDRALAARLQSLSFITFEHLDISSFAKAKEGDADIDWSCPEQELREMWRLRCPGDKLARIVRCTKLMTSLLMTSAASKNGSLPGADEFLPALILLVKRSNPPKLHSNLEFIQHFRDPSKLTIGEAGYAFTQFMSAVHFLEEADSSALTITPEEFERGLDQSRRSAREGLYAHQAMVAKEEAQQIALHERGTPTALNGNGSSKGGIEKEATSKVGYQKSAPTPAWPTKEVSSVLSIREIRTTRRRQEQQGDNANRSNRNDDAAFAALIAGTPASFENNYGAYNTRLRR